MRLEKLEAQFLRLEHHIETWTRRNPDGTEEQVTGPREYHVFVDTLVEAQGIQFLCPKCFIQNGGNVGTHMVLCWFKNRGVPDNVCPKPGRWIPAGTGISDLTFIGPGAVSVLLTSEDGCRWHGFVSNGDAT